MQITPETAMIAVGTRDSPLSRHEEAFLLRWATSGRWTFLVNGGDDIKLAELPQRSGDVLLWSSDIECIFLSSPIMYQLCRRACRSLLFVGTALEDAVETNIRMASSLGFFCYLLDFESDLLDQRYRERMSRYCTILTLEQVCRDIDMR